MAANGEFLKIVGVYYNEIKNSFVINSQALKIDFDEDVFHDTIVRCGDLYEDDINDCKKIKAYLWVSYKTNILNKLERIKPMESFENLVDFDIIDEEYIPEMDEFYDIVKNELLNSFDKNIVDMWFEHVCENKTYEEIEEKSGINNVHYQFKKIRNFIRNEIAVKNERFIEIMKILDRKL